MKQDDPMQRCPCQAVRDRCDASGQMPLFDLTDLLTPAEIELLEAQRVEIEMFRPEQRRKEAAEPVTVSPPRESTNPIKGDRQ